MADTNTYYVVRIGDTLWSIAKNNGLTLAELRELNPSKANTDLIYPGEKLLISGTATATTTTNSGNAVTITAFGPVSTAPRTIFVTWAWAKDNTENYRVIWRYLTNDKNDAGEKIWFTGSDSNTSNEDTRESTYNAPENAIAVKVKIKPMAETSGTTASWTGEWTTEKVYYFNSTLPSTPDAPSVSIEGYKLTTGFDGLNTDLTHIEFETVTVHDEKVFNKSGKIPITAGYVSYSCTIQAGYKYKVRCRLWQDDLYSDWSEYSGSVDSLPTAPSIIQCVSTSKTSAKLEWTKVESADSYEIQYCIKKEYFDSIGGDVTSTTVTNDTADSETTISKNLLNLATGSEYFIRIRAANKNDVSDWSEIKSFVIGIKPAAPTTWSSTTTVAVGDTLNLYWIHNSKDGSSQTYAELELTFNGKHSDVFKIKNSTDDEEKDKTSVYSLVTSGFDEGVTIEWRVRTAGVTTTTDGSPEYGDWSILRKVEIYAPAAISVNLENANNEVLDLELTALPLYVKATAGNTANQKPTGYYVSITTNESYTTTDNVGNDKVVSVGSKVYSKYFDITDTSLSVEITASDLTLENNVTYTVICTVSMDSGLSASSSSTFKVAWGDNGYVPFAEIGIDKDTISAYIRPYSNGGDNDILSVYRRDYDGSFIEIATNLKNSSKTFVTDPHPSLDYARYRIISKNTVNGVVKYNDIPGYPVGIKSVVIQWDEAWQPFEVSEDDVMEQPAWSGSMLKLPYNIDVSDNNNPDVSLVEYIGRKYPVSYYGTQIGSSATWSVAIPKSDKETLYALRRLSVWMGNVYVREPSGSGYWANIKISFSQKHRELTIPVTMNISRVEGGM